jgi:hypothetical protein
MVLGKPGRVPFPLIPPRALSSDVSARPHRVCVRGVWPPAVPWLPVAHAQHDLAENVTLDQPRVRLRGLGERVRRGNRHLEPSGRNRPSQALELADAGVASYDWRETPRRLRGAGSTPFGNATRPPCRTPSSRRVSGFPPANGRTASTPPGANASAAAARSSRRPSAAASAPRRRTNAMPSRPDAVARTLAVDRPVGRRDERQAEAAVETIS